MKWIDNLIYTLLSACLLAGCEDSGSKELERMQGYWVPVSYTHLDVYKRQPLPPAVRYSAAK